MDHGLHYDSAGLVFRVGSPVWRRVGRVLINAQVGNVLHAIVGRADARRAAF